MTTDEDVELVPPGFRFDMVWRGYDRRQVNEFPHIEVRTIAMDRDAAVDMVADLAGQGPGKVDLRGSAGGLDAVKGALQTLVLP